MYISSSCNMKVPTLILFCFSTVLAFPGISHPRPSIPTRGENNLLVVGGNDAMPHAHPYQVSLQMPLSLGNWGHICGGSIIAPNKIVTAAHCIDTGLSPTTMRIVAGDHDLSKSEGTEQIRMWKSAVFHERWNLDTIDWDYGVITLVSNLTYNNYVQPISLAETGSTPSGECTVSGWGYDNNQGHLPNILQEVYLPYVSQSKCNDIYSAIDWAITDRMVCAGGEVGRSACNGDSGGPLICQGTRGSYLAGIASYVMTPCGDYAYPGGFANVAYGRDWLLSH